MANEEPRIRTRHIADYQQDPNNLRVHNPRNIGVIVDSLHEVGAGRSLVADQDDVIQAGNGVLEAAAEAGITKVLEIETDGDELVVVKRKLTDEQKRALAIYDNRAGELSQWNVEGLRQAVSNGALSSLNAWHRDEIAAMAAIAAADDSVPEWSKAQAQSHWVGMPEYTAEDQMPVAQIIVSFTSMEDRTAFAALIGQEFTEKTRWIWFPAQKRRKLQDQQYMTDETVAEDEP